MYISNTYICACIYVCVCAQLFPKHKGTTKQMTYTKCNSFSVMYFLVAHIYKLVFWKCISMYIMNRKGSRTKQVMQKVSHFKICLYKQVKIQKHL